MYKTLLVSAIVLAMLFGFAGAGVAAAQQSEPDDPLYSLQGLGEQIHLRNWIHDQTQSQEQLRLELEDDVAPADPAPDCDCTQQRDQDRTQQQDQDRTQLQNQLRIHQAEPSVPETNGNGSNPEPTSQQERNGGAGKP